MFSFSTYGEAARPFLLPFTLLALLLVASFASAANRTDLAVYGDHQPVKARGGSWAMPLPITSCDSETFPNNCTSENTTLDLEVVNGLRNPLGSQSWGLATFGKYVLMGNFEEKGYGFSYLDAPITMSGQHIGIFNTETKAFCTLFIDDDQGGVEWLETATPLERKSRIYFQGFPSGFGDAAASFGYIVADLDNDDPCNSTTGWEVVAKTAQEINAAASSSLPAPCPRVQSSADSAFCGFDGMRILHHDEDSCLYEDCSPEEFGMDTIVLNNWLDRRLVVIRVDDDGTLDIPDVHELNELWQPDGTGEACFQLNPLIRPVLNPTSDEEDLRFAISYDPLCGPPDGTAGCEAWAPFCPGNLDTCSICRGGSCTGTSTSCTTNAECDSTCSTKVCSSSRIFCTSNGDCTGGGGTCTNACFLTHPSMKCRNSGDTCATDSDCEAEDFCTCAAPGSPVQEFQLTSTGIGPTSDPFQSAANKGGFALAYDSDGGFWKSEAPADNFNDPYNEGSGIAVFSQSSGSHAYDDSGGIVSPDEQFPFNGIWFNGPFASVQVNDVMYTVGRATIERAIRSSGTWSKDPNYRAFLASEVLPVEAGKCSSGVDVDLPCRTNADCTGGTCGIDQYLNIGEFYKADLAHGGSPPSLWTTPRYQAEERNLGFNTWLVRVPVPTPIPDGVSNVRAAVAWAEDASCSGTCNRLWLVAEHNNQLKFRVRSDGIWSPWYALPTNIATAGGASMVFYSGKVEVFARSTGGAVITTKLTSSLGCDPSACTWSSWATVPGAPTTNKEVGVAVQDFGTTQGIFLAVSAQSDDQISYARRSGSTWSSWHSAGTKVGTPSVVSNPADQTGRMWIIAKKTDGDFAVGKVNSNLGFGLWTSLPNRPSGVTAWSAPSIVREKARCQSNGILCTTNSDCGSSSCVTRIRLFAAQSNSPNKVYEVTSTASNWDSWDTLHSGARSIAQPYATISSGDLNLFTLDSSNTINDQISR